jgi:UDP-N-acetylglucosamine 2-epimerase (non-hydrolysing)
VDDPRAFERLCGGIGAVAADVPIVFPVHPRTRPALARSDGARALIDQGRLRVVDPLGYLEFIGLMEGSRVTLTDSGGVQEETTILGVPCLTLRENTERPVTVTHGTNQIVGGDPERIIAGWRRAQQAADTPPAPPFWDGRAAGRIAGVLRQWRDASR